MDNSWENFEPAPIEHMHARMLDLWHQLRKERGNDSSTMPIDGSDLNKIIAQAKVETINKYRALNLDKAIPKE